MSKTIDIFQVDAFAEKLFTGNPAAVCIMDEWISDPLMQRIAAENNLAETAFIVENNGQYDIRWFTPKVEVELCGHATLASAYVLFRFFHKNRDKIEFHSRYRNKLCVTKKDEDLLLDLPSDKLIPVSRVHKVEKCLGFSPVEVYKGKTDYVALLNSENEIANLEPDFRAISLLDARGLIVTAPSKTCDFVSRFFAPLLGIAEDPVTGSAHTSLIPLWSEKLGKKEMKAKQLSLRGGKISCVYSGDRCFIGGQAQLFMKGVIQIPD